MFYWVFFFIFWGTSGLAAFLAPEYERLDESTLKTRFDKRSDRSAESLESAFFYLDYLELTLSIHRAEQVSAWLYDRCSSGEFSDPKSSLVCAMVFARAVESASAWDRATFLKRSLELFNHGSGADPKDKMYAEARIYQSLPPLPGVRPTQSLVALNFLQRTAPEASSLKYFLSKGYERIGNRHAYEDWKRKALEAKDRRATLDFEKPIRLVRAQNDGVGSGFSPRLFVSPNGGFGGMASYHDDRLFDLDRSFSIGGFATTRSQWGAEFRARDFELVAPTGILGDVKLFGGEQDTFDLGPHSAFGSHFTPTIQRQEGRIAFQEPFQRVFALELGWMWFHQTATNPGNPARLLAYPDASAVYFSGPYFEIGLDTRDSDYLPREGGYLKFFGNFPTDGLLSPRSLERYRLSGGYFLPGLFRQHVISIQGAGHWVGGIHAPWAAYPRVGSPLKGLREGRFSDRALVEATADYAFPIALGFGLDIFGNAAAVNGTISSAVGGAYELGGGAGLTWNSDVNRAASWQISVGRFGGETAVVAGGSLGF